MILKSSFSDDGHLKEIYRSDNYFGRSPSKGNRFKFETETSLAVRALFDLALFWAPSLNLFGDVLIYLNLLLYPPFSDGSVSRVVAGVSKLNCPDGFAMGVATFIYLSGSDMAFAV